jgi:pimeloyl-ACP methyl ester carboxylesterase
VFFLLLSPRRIRPVSLTFFFVTDTTLAMSAPIILFPGLAADARLFAPQLEAFPGLIIPQWIAPLPQETLAAYAKRLAQGLPIPQSGPYILGGMSFGSMVAQEVVAHLPHPPALVALICGVRSRAQFTPFFLTQERLARWVPARLQKQLYGVYAKGFAAREGLSTAHTQLLLEQGKDIDPVFFKWASRACAEWPATPVLPESLPIWHIHGSEDSVIPDPLQQATTVITGGKHLLTYSAADAVTQWLKKAQVVAGKQDFYLDQ